jgi:hypothetical protein
MLTPKVTEIARASAHPALESGLNHELVPQERRNGQQRPVLRNRSHRRSLPRRVSHGALR